VLDKTRIWYNAVFGALGGLLAWTLIGLVLRFQTTNTTLLFVKDALQGAVVGLCIGLALGMVEGLLVSRSARRTLRGGCLGALIGLVAGLVGLVLGEVIYLAAGGGVWPRAVGWAVFGLLIGTSEGIAAGSKNTAGYGALGGLLGGLIGGATYERTSLLVRSLTHNRDLSLTLGGALGLMILGACIGAFTTLAVDILRKAWLKGVYGKLEGQTLTVTKAETTLGRGEKCDIRIPGDPTVAEQHAAILQTPQGFVLEAREGPVLVNRQQVTRQVLQSGMHLTLGKAVLAFYAEG
jgi:hypothetical protein